MKKVLHYVGCMDRGGMEMFIMNLFNHIDRKEMMFDFAIHGSNVGDFQEEIRNLGGSWYFFQKCVKTPSNIGWHGGSFGKLMPESIVHSIFIPIH